MIANNVKNPHLQNKNNAGFVINQPRTTQQEVMMKINDIGKLNKQAMQNFKLGEKDTALKQLTQAEKLCESLKQYWYFKQKELGDMLANNFVCKAFTTTYNNLGVFHKSSGKTNLAIKYLKQVLEIEQEMTNGENQEQEIASTFVNICSIYSEMGKHDIALTYIKKAVDYLDEAYEHKLHSITDQKERRQFIQIVATAFHNAGVEYEFLKNYPKCLQFYQKSFGICLQHLGSEHPLTQTFEKSLIGAQRKINTMPPQHIIKEKSLIILPQKKKKPKSLNTRRTGTNKSQRQPLQQKLNKINQDISMGSLSPMSLHHKGEIHLSNRNQSNKSQSQIKRPLPYIQSQLDNRIINNSNIDMLKIANNLKNNNLMSNRSVQQSNQGIYANIDTNINNIKDKQEYFSIRDLLEVSRNEIREELQQYNSSQLINKINNHYNINNIQKQSDRQNNNTLDIKSAYKTIAQPSKLKQQKKQINNTLDLMLQNDPNKRIIQGNKNRKAQNITIDYINNNNYVNNYDKMRKKSKPPLKPLKLQDNLNNYENKYVDIQSIVTNKGLNTIVDNQMIKQRRQENIQAVNRNKLKHNILDKQNGISSNNMINDNNLGINLQQQQLRDLYNIDNGEQGGSEEFSKSKRYEVFDEQNFLSINHDSNARMSQNIHNEDKLENMINNLKKDLNLSYQHPRSPSKFISKTDYIKQLDPQHVKKLRNAAITFKQMLKAKLYYVNFQRCYVTKKANYQYIRLYNKHQKYTLTKILKECAEYRQKVKVVDEKRQLIRQKDQLLELIESKQNSPDVINNRSIKGLAQDTSLNIESALKRQQPNLIETFNHQVDNVHRHQIISASGDLRDSQDFNEPIVLKVAQEEIAQINMINSRARRQKVMESLKSNKGQNDKNIQDKNQINQSQVQSGNPQQDISSSYQVQHKYERESKLTTKPIRIQNDNILKLYNQSNNSATSQSQHIQFDQNIKMYKQNSNDDYIQDFMPKNESPRSQIQVKVQDLQSMLKQGQFQEETIIKFQAVPSQNQQNIKSRIRKYNQEHYQAM